MNKKKNENPDGQIINEPVETESEQNEDPIALAEVRYAELYDKYLRLAAEYENFRKRTEKEKGELAAYATAKTVEKLLPTLDNLERAAANKTGDIKTYAEGVELVLRGMKDSLSSIGVSEIDSLNRPFDPELHNAVSTADASGGDENTVVEVYQKGYTLNGKVIRHAMVKVAN